MKWSVALLIGWAAMLGLSTAKQLLPASFWLDAGETIVEHARVGECPRMVFSREINREFHAEWLVTIMRERPDGGGFATFSVFEGASDYRPENRLPTHLDLCWWVGKDRIVLPAGTYRVHTLWSLLIPGGGEREIRRTSNTFIVSEG